MVFMQLLFVSQHLKAKASGKKLQKVLLKVTPRGIILHDSVTNKLIENVSIYRISYCTADKLHDKVFAYIAQSQQNETLECHAFLCTKRKMAQAVTLTVAQAFKVAFEIWQVSRDGKEKREKAGSDGEGTSSSQSEGSSSIASLKGGMFVFLNCCSKTTVSSILREVMQCEFTSGMDQL
ncbi:hypothetical protein GDO81_005891 [Engystomops pustulosus]|uniref:PID domain-containing protein n=1 Tax=Engystomops pustulosus TaxID=76066 RepID=A0AAV7CSR2_ENGPU|nr:hypothetical protein GDO81_005891 [Engystomops pustulosus]